MGIGGVLRNDSSEVLLMFSINVGIRDSNEAQVLAIFGSFFEFLSASLHGLLLVESDTSTAVAWLLKCDFRPWKFQFHFNESKELSSSLVVSFCHVLTFANTVTDALAKQGADRSSW